MTRGQYPTCDIRKFFKFVTFTISERIVTLLEILLFLT